MELRVAESEREREGAELKLEAAELKMDAMTERFDEAKNSLRMQANIEKESRDGWKDRYQEDHKALTEANKLLNHIRNENADLRLKLQAKERQITDEKEQKEAFKLDRDTIRERLSNSQAEKETNSRQLATAQALLDQFEKAKKADMKELLQKYSASVLSETRLQMRIEDVLAELKRHSLKIY